MVRSRFFVEDVAAGGRDGDVAEGGLSAATDSRSFSIEERGETVGEPEGDAMEDASENEESPETSVVASPSSSSELSLLSSTSLCLLRRLSPRPRGGRSESARSVCEPVGDEGVVGIRAVGGAETSGVSGPVVEIDGIGIPP